MAATMKRDDMVKERADLIWAMGEHAIRFLTPLCSLINGTSRVMYLNEEIRKVTPKPAVVKDEAPANGTSFGDISVVSGEPATDDKVKLEFQDA